MAETTFVGMRGRYATFRVRLSKGNLAATVLRSGSLRRALRRIAPTFSLGADYLASRADADSTRLVMVAPEQYVERISPRPLLMVNGIDDPQMPRRAVESLYQRARAPKDLIWLRTGHLMPSDSSLVRLLVDTTLARLPALQGARSSRAR